MISSTSQHYSSDHDESEQAANFHETMAALPEHELIDLYIEGAEDDLLSHLQETADAARRAADAYTRKAAEFEAIAEEYDQAKLREETKLRLKKEKREALIAENLLEEENPNLTDQGNEMRW